MRYVVVEPRKAEETIKRLRAAGISFNGAKVIREERAVLIPIVEEATPEQLQGFETVSRGTDPPKPRPNAYRDLLDLPEEVKKRLPRAFDVVGDIAILRLPVGLETHADQIASAFKAWNSAIRRVAMDWGVEGDLRVRNLAAVGEERRETLHTVHHENGLRLTVDLSGMYFSPRLSGERLRVAQQARAGERVLDMFAGVGPFAILIAKRCPECEVVAVDMNPIACSFLRANAGANRARVEVREGSIEALAPTLGRFDRIIMNLPRSGDSYLGTALRLLGLQGGAVHLYVVANKTEMVTKEERMRRLAQESGWDAHVKVRPLKTFATRVWIWAVDLTLRPAKDRA